MNKAAGGTIHRLNDLSATILLLAKDSNIIKAF
jgi:hypothetical protein